jgi:hypothetical protein
MSIFHQRFETCLTISTGNVGVGQVNVILATSAIGPGRLNATGDTVRETSAQSQPEERLKRKGARAE